MRTASSTKRGQRRPRGLVAFLEVDRFVVTRVFEGAYVLYGKDLNGRAAQEPSPELAAGIRNGDAVELHGLPKAEMELQQEGLTPYREGLVEALAVQRRRSRGELDEDSEDAQSPMSRAEGGTE